MFGWKGIDLKIYEISVFYGFRSFAKEFDLVVETAKKWNTKFKITMSQLIVQIYKFSHTALRTKSKSYESQARCPSHRLAGKSEQTFSLESTQKRTTVDACDIFVLFVA